MRIKLQQKTLPQDWHGALTTMASTEQISYLLGFLIRSQVEIDAGNLHFYIHSTVQ